MAAHDCLIVEISNDSYRFKHSSTVAKSRIKESEQSRKSAKAGPSDEQL
ncbi:MAG: hypothetical protein ABI135_05215 [Rhodoferax sp.]